MSSRKEEKERLREERRAAEEAERKAGARKRQLGVAGGVIGSLAVAGLLMFVVLGGDDGADKTKTTEVDEAELVNVVIPAQEESDYEKAAEAAGCTLQHPPIEGASHDDEKEFAPSDYKSNPPHSGNHNGTVYEDGRYEPGAVPRLGMLVHTLEHGRINIQYKPGTPKADVLKLEKLFLELEEGRHMLLYENTTDMPYQVAATAWGHVLGCPAFNDKTFDAIRTFRARYIDKGPEDVP